MKTCPDNLKADLLGHRLMSYISRLKSIGCFRDKVTVIEMMRQHENLYYLATFGSAFNLDVG